MSRRLLELFSETNTVARGRNSRGKLDSIPGFQGPNSCRLSEAIQFEGIWRKYIDIRLTAREPNGGPQGREGMASVHHAPMPHDRQGRMATADGRFGRPAYEKYRS